MPVPPFEQFFRVESADIDLQGHVNNIVYLRWVQNIATAHWNFAAPSEAQDLLMWVVSRHEIDYKNAALLGDEIRVKTWIGTAKGLLFERNTEIRRENDQQILAVARTLWIPLNKQTRRPQRLSAELRELFSASE